MVKKKIVFFVWNMGNGAGTERVLAVIANGLSKREYSVAILNIKGMGPSFFPLEDAVRVYWLDDSHGPWSAVKGTVHSKAIRMGIFLKYEKPDFLIDVDITNSLVSFFMKPLVPDSHWYVWEHRNYSIPGLAFRFNFKRKLAQRLVCRFADHLLVLTDADKRDYVNNRKIKCGISFLYNPLPYEGEFLKHTEKKFIFTAGRLVDQKGFDLLIDSWKLLECKHPDWSVLIAGEGEERENLETLADHSGLHNIHFLGSQKDIEKIYAEAAFFVLPSMNEAFGMVLIEAMYFSLPVISYDCKNGPGEIITDGKDGFLVPPGDIKGFSEKMELLINDEKLREDMGRNAKESVRRFEKEKILDQWESLLRL